MRGEPEYSVYDLEIACGAWLAVMLERMRHGRLPVPHIDQPLDRSGTDKPLQQSAAADFDAHAPELWNERHDLKWGWHLEPREEQSPVLVTLLERLYQAAKHEPFEEDLWDVVWDVMPGCFPSSIANDMIDRPVSESMLMHLGHLDLDDQVLWRLTDEVDEALLTLGKRRYVLDEYDADRFEEVLHAYPDHEWLLESLAQTKPDDDQKLQRLAQYIHRASCRDAILSATLTIPQIVYAVRAIDF